MPMLALNLSSEDRARLSPALSFGVANPLPSRRSAPPAAAAALYDLQGPDATPMLDLRATESAWAPTERLGL